jgi:Ca-activated chloride channel family protein
VGRLRFKSIAYWLGPTLFAGLALSQTNVFKVDVQLVRVLTTVKDPSGKLIGSLKKEEFTIKDNGVPQQISVFEHHTETPLSIALMVDTSGSTAKDLKYEVTSVGRFLRSMFHEGNPDDRVAMYSFNWEIVRQWGYSHNLMQLEKSMKNFKAEAGTSMYDAIYLGSQDLEDREGRHVMVIVTDGADTVSSKTYQQALQALHHADTVFYAILVVPITNDAGRSTGGENALTTLARDTGGRVFAPSIGPGLDAAFDEILHDLRTQYLIGYYPKNVPLTKNPFHTIEIKTSLPDLRVISRNGYYGKATDR